MEYLPETVGSVRQRSIHLFDNYMAFSAPAKRITRFVEIKFLYNKYTFFKVNFHPEARNYSHVIILKVFMVHVSYFTDS